MKPTLKAPGTKHLKLKYIKLLSILLKFCLNLAFNFNLRRYNMEMAACGKLVDPPWVATDAGKPENMAVARLFWRCKPGEALQHFTELILAGRGAELPATLPVVDAWHAVGNPIRWVGVDIVHGSVRGVSVHTKPPRRGTSYRRNVFGGAVHAGARHNAVRVRLCAPQEDALPPLARAPRGARLCLARAWHIRRDPQSGAFVRRARVLRSSDGSHEHGRALPLQSFPTLLNFSAVVAPNSSHTAQLHHSSVVVGVPSSHTQHSCTFRHNSVVVQVPGTQHCTVVPSQLCGVTSTNHPTQHRCTTALWGYELSSTQHNTAAHPTQHRASAGCSR